VTIVPPNFSSNTALEYLTLRRINLDNTDLAVTDFSRLGNLTALDVSGNKLLTKLPAALSQCLLLQQLDVRDCALSDQDSVFDMKNTRVSYLRLDNNGIDTLSANTICRLSNFVTSSGSFALYLSGNSLSSLPDCIWNYPISTLTLGSTKFATFPTGLFGFSLNTLSWNGNDRVMTVADNTWNIQKWYADLKTLELINTKISAPFPIELRKCLRLTKIHAAGNSFSGTLPDDFFANGGVEDFDITDSSLSGPFPAGGFSDYMTRIRVKGNKFTTIPDTIQQFSSSGMIWEINFSDNDLAIIPSNEIWASITSLNSIWVGGNPRLTGSIPTAWLQSGSVNASFCSFTGNVPALTSRVYELYLSGNLLAGTIQPPVSSQSLRAFDVSQNALHGEIPSAFGDSSGSFDWSSLTTFNVSYNRLTGTFPSNLNRLVNLVRLGLNNNGLSGALPDFSQLSNVSHFEGHTNFFSICQSNPKFASGSLTLQNCSVVNNLYPGACHCPSFVQGLCQADLTCPSPDYVPVNVPLGEAPTPIRPPSVFVAPSTSSTNPEPNNDDSVPNVSGRLGSSLLLLSFSLAFIVCLGF
jgi:Leucine-rich repeat (LRR) protein